MATQRAGEIYDEIIAHINKEGGGYSTWYAGITSDIEDRLFGFHQVPKKEHWYIWRPTLSAEDARQIEEALHDIGCDGAPGGGDDTCTDVYCYKISSTTRER